MNFAGSNKVLNLFNLFISNIHFTQNFSCAFTQMKIMELWFSASSFRQQGENHHDISKILDNAS